jgi:hypothetical protein
MTVHAVSPPLDVSSEQQRSVMVEGNEKTMLEASSDSLQSDLEHSPGSQSPVGGGFWTAAATKQLRRRLDWRLLPFLSLLYLCVGFMSLSPTFSSLPLLTTETHRLSFLDRTNIGNGKLAHLEADIGIDPLSVQFNVSGTHSRPHHPCLAITQLTLALPSLSISLGPTRPLSPSFFPFMWRRKSRPTSA